MISTCVFDVFVVCSSRSPKIPQSFFDDKAKALKKQKDWNPISLEVDVMDTFFGFFL